MLFDALSQAYTMLKLQFYRTVFPRFQSREASLTTVETFSLEIIMALGMPTLNEFAQYVGISTSNAAYRVANLVQKGYLLKEQSEEDKREFYLVATPKCEEYYSINLKYVERVTERMQQRFPEEDIAHFEEMLRVMTEELMPEIKEKTPSTAIGQLQK